MKSTGRTLLALVAFLANGVAAYASGLSLEGGLIPSVYFPAGSSSDANYFGGGASGTASYEFDQWSIGGRFFGTLSNATDFHINAGTYDLYGNLRRRYYGIDVFSRYFFPTPKDRTHWYIEFGFMGVETDFIHLGNVYVLPQSPDYTRVFLRGGGFSIGAGFRPAKGPFFFQLNYELVHYENLQVVGKVKSLHPILASPALNYNYFIHSIVVTVGLDVFGRQSSGQ